MNTVAHRVMRLLVPLCIILLTACAAVQPSAPFQAGETARVDYTCRTLQGELVATTEKAATGDSRLPKAPIYGEPDSYEAVTLTIGPEDKCSTCPQEKTQLEGFNVSLHASLAAAIEGLSPGRFSDVHLAREIPEGMPAGKRYLGLAKVFKRPKNTSILVDDFRKMAQREPEVGFQYPFEMGLQARVIRIEHDRVFIDYEPVVTLGEKVSTPIGQGIIRDGGDRWLIENPLVENQLVRINDLVGKVVEVDDKMIYIDFGHPFGGLELVCDITAKRPAE